MINKYADFTREIDGQVMFNTAGLIAIAGDAAHSCEPGARLRGRAMFGALLDAAARGGWRDRDLLETIFAKGEQSERLRDLCRDAAACIAPEELTKAMAAAGFNF